MALSNEEKSKRSAKKMHEAFDERLIAIFNDDDFSDEVIKAYALADPKGFMQIFGSRLPKVQPVDQDLQRTFISLKEMMLELPEVEDIAKALKKSQAAVRSYKLKFEQAEERAKFMENKFKALQAKCQTK